MRMLKITSLIVVLTAAGTQLSAAAPAFKGAELAKLASVQLSSAERIALKARPGIVTDRELEKEKGGSGLRYSFDIKAQGKTFEVGVDAKTGKVLENAAEGKNPD